MKFLGQLLMVVILLTLFSGVAMGIEGEDRPLANAPAPCSKIISPW